MAIEQVFQNGKIADEYRIRFDSTSYPMICLINHEKVCAKIRRAFLLRAIASSEYTFIITLIHENLWDRHHYNNEYYSA